MNIETKLWADYRFQDLILKAGSRHAAKGMVLELFTLAQEHWFPDQQPIPREVFDGAGLGPTLVVGLAEEVEGGVRCKGSKEAFAWLFQKQGAGKKSGETRKKTQRKPKRTSTDVNARSTDDNVREPLTLNLTLPPSLDHSPSGVSNELALVPPDSLPLPKASKFTDATKGKMRAFLATFASAYREKYGAPPEGVRDKAIVGKVGHWIEHVSEERACQLAQVFLQIDYRPIAESQHDLWLFFRHLNRIGNALSTGKDPGSIDWGRVFAGGGAA